jgi:hypothetical protein
LLACLFIFAQCKKDKQSSTSDNPYGLPNATQEGKNTLGFLLNGVAWTPKGYNGTANLSIDFDEGVNNGIMGIVAYRTLSSADKTQFILGITDSLNFKLAPFTNYINTVSIGGLSFSTKDYCDILHADNTIFQEGKISILKLDRTAKIVSGTFEGRIFKQICGDTLKITLGRFDMSY